MTHWYALRCRDELMTADFLNEAGYLAYAPRERLLKTSRGKPKPDVRERALFPGYVFTLCSEQAFSAVRAIGSSEDFVRYTTPAGVRVPLRLPDDALVPILLAEMCGVFDQTRQPPPWKPERGASAKVIAGLWSGYLGKILSVGKKKAVLQTQWCKLEIELHELAAAA